MSPAPNSFFGCGLARPSGHRSKDLLIFVEKINDWLVLWKSLEHLKNFQPDLMDNLYRPWYLGTASTGASPRLSHENIVKVPTMQGELSRAEWDCWSSTNVLVATRVWPGPAILETALCVKIDGVLIPISKGIHEKKWWVPSGNDWHSYGIDGPVEIVDLPSYKMVDLSIAFCMFPRGYHGKNNVQGVLEPCPFDMYRKVQDCWKRSADLPVRHATNASLS